MSAPKFQLAAGDRVDFIDDVPNGTPGTVRSRVIGRPRPEYRVDWDDGNTDLDTVEEVNLLKLN